MEDKDGEKRFPNGDVYEGDFSGALPHGKGKYRWRDGTAYEGDWEEGKMTGKGKMTWRSGGTYEGEFSGGYLHGFGVFVDGKDGSEYRGSWRMNVIHGVGEKRYGGSGDCYEGTWKEGLHEGSGKYSWAHGSGGTYIGSWKSGKMNGRGVMKWPNGDLFDGVWANGLRHGNGIYRFCHGGGYYFGTWSRGLKDGNGIFYPAESHGKKILLPCSSLDSEGSQSQRSMKPSPSAQTSGVRRSASERFSGGGFARSSSRREKERVSSSAAAAAAVEQPPVEAEGVVYEREYVQGVLINEKPRHFSEVSKKCKARNKFHSDKVSKKASSSCIDVIEGRWSHYLSLSLQLGIRYTVGKITPVPVREVRSSDFGDRARIKMYFPRRGSQFTPPHDSIDFYWKDYCPMVFRNLREMFKLDAADYMMSICGDDGLRELSSPGKSGSIFYLSHDDRFVIKTLNRSELKVLLTMLPNYYSHVGEHENTLITKFFGLHHIKLKGGRKVRFVVMGNMFYTELQIHRRYDLKGSTHGRFTDPDKIDQNTTMKDCDLQYEFHMDKLLRSSLFKQISLDSKFLESQCIIDYSLLVGLHFRAPEQLRSLKPPDAMQNLDSFFPSEKGENSNSMRDQIPPNALILVTHEPGSVSSVPGPHIRGKTLKAYSLGDREVDVLLPGTARLRVQLGVNMPAQARHKLPHDEADSKDVELFEVYDVIVYMGIIDILQEYDLRKRLERACKSMKFDPESISVAEPGLYARRFTKFLEKIFPNHS